VLVGGEAGGRWRGGVDRTLRALVLSPFVRQKLGTWIATHPHEDLEALREPLEAGKVMPVVDRTFPLSQLPEAIPYVREGRARQGPHHHVRRRLKAWDFVHCPPWTRHVFVGAGDAPCVIVMTGSRAGGFEVRYVADETAAKHGAAPPKDTSDPDEAYSTFGPEARVAYGGWLP
jgi:hypothetical protein